MSLILSFCLLSKGLTYLPRLIPIEEIGKTFITENKDMEVPENRNASVGGNYMSQMGI